MDYKIVRNSYLANGLAFLGFRYRKFENEQGVEYRFTYSEELNNTIGKLLTIKKELGN